MILQALYELYDRLRNEPEYELPEPGFSIQKISFKIVIKPDGSLVDIQDVREVSGAKRISAQKKVFGNGKSSGSGLNPCTLWDNPAYMLGYKKEDEKPERTLQSFEEFQKHHLALKNEINSPDFDAVCEFLANWNPQNVYDESGECKYPVLDENGFGLFQILGKEEFVHENPVVLSWWESKSASSDDRVKGQCLLTGKFAEIARLQPKIKGVSGGQSMGVSIVAFNDDAYESYGKKQSFNAPVSTDAAFRYGVALNALLDGPMKSKHKIHLADATVVFWTESKTSTENIFAQFAAEGIVDENVVEAQDEKLHAELRAFVKSLRRGGKAESVSAEEAGTRFYLLALSPNAARASVRFFHQSTVEELYGKLARHFEDIRIERGFKDNSKHPDPEFPAFWQLLRQAARDSKEVPPLLSAPLLNAAITGANYPRGLYSAVIRRLRAGEKVNYLKACVIKGYLNRNHKMEVSMSLDKERTDLAYRLGRLFSVFEKAQVRSHTKDGGKAPNANIRDKFYSSASATPGNVFPRLFKTYGHHLSKISEEKPYWERLVQEIMEPINDFPSHLDLTEQGLFAIGYYHQNLDFYTKKEDRQDNNSNEEE